MEKEHHERQCHTDFAFLGTMIFAGFETNVSGVHTYFPLLVCLILQREALCDINSTQNGNWRPWLLGLGEGGFHYS